MIQSAGTEVLISFNKNCRAYSPSLMSGSPFARFSAVLFQCSSFRAALKVEPASDMVSTSVSVGIDIGVELRDGVGNDGIEPPSGSGKTRWRAGKRCCKCMLLSDK